MKKHLANLLIIGMVLAGTVFLGSYAGIGREGETVSTLFLCFFGLIIAIQVVPALMLLGFLLREIFRLTLKGKEGSQGADR